MTRTASTRWVVIGLMAVGLAVAARFATLAVLGSPVAKPVESPVLSIRPTQLDFGDVWEQEQFVWPVHVENTTDQPQDVQSISGSCACQTFEPRSFTLPPHGKQRVAVSVNLSQADKQGQTGETPFRVAIWATVAGQPKQFEWLLSGRVKQAIRVPQRLDLGRVSDLAPEKAAFTFGVPALTKLSGLHVKAMGEVTDAALTLVPTADRLHFNVTVTPRQRLKAGLHETTLTLTPEDLDGKLLPAKTVPVRFTVGPDIQATPDLIYTGHREPGATHSETITLHSVSGRTMTVTKVEAVGPGLTVKPLANTAGLTTFAVEQVIQATGTETAAKFVVTLNTGETVAVAVPVISAVPTVPRPEARK